MAGYNAMKGKRYRRAACGFCDKDVALNVTGELRAHEGIATGQVTGPCLGAGLPMAAQVQVEIEWTDDDTVGMYSTCAVCGDLTPEDEATDHKAYRAAHNHRKPKVQPDGHRFTVTWYSYGKSQWRRRYADTHEAAMEIAADIRER